MSTFAWIAIGVAGWLAVALTVGPAIGRMIRGRDRQTPREPGGLIPTPENADEMREERELW